MAAKKDQASVPSDRAVYNDLGQFWNDLFAMPIDGPVTQTVVDDLQKIRTDNYNS